MNGMSEPLPGLLDDPQFQLPDLPALTDFHIAPLRDPAPPRHNNAPLPLEPVTANAVNASRSTHQSTQTDGPSEQKKTPKITPNDVLQARESKNPHLAISEIIEHNDGPDSPPVQLPSFVSLSVVEKSPIQAPSAISADHASKRPRLDQDIDLAAHDFGRQLPRPAHKEQPHARPAPLLPAMVTGLHEPPPSAALLPSMDPAQRPATVRTATAKIQVKDILISHNSGVRSPAKLPPLPAISELHPAKQPTENVVGQKPKLTTFPSTTLATDSSIEVKEGKEGKPRRTRRRWTESETQDLLRGVEKHGVGRWKQILEDSSFLFDERTTVDLKDRYRVSAKEKEESTAPETCIPAMSVEPTSRRAAGPSEESAGSMQNGQGTQRRKRRAWTPGEDERLIKGIQKHGFQWTNIHDDPDLDLTHRRATDLRDRIRNKFPDGYRHAESAPLRSEVKKAEKSKSTKKRSSSELQKSSEDLNSKEKEQTNAGLTLPSLTFGDDDDMDDWDNRLPPLIDWDDLGNMGV